MTRPRLVAITDLSQLDPPTLLARLRRLAEAAVPGSLALLLRDHAASGRERLRLGRELRASSRATGQELWVADRIDLARLLEADGLHLGEGSVPARLARELWPRDRWLSRAWHGRDLAAASELEGVNALLVSPVLAERKGRTALGLDALTRLSHAAATQPEPLALYALGGVSSDSANRCLAAGADGVAAIAAALAPDPRALLDALGIAR
jgi:thiamine-phosphate pyrophosphorylase